MKIICAVRSNPLVFSKEKIEKLHKAWNAGFQMKFHEFREGLVRIAEYNRSKMNPGFHEVLAHPSENLCRLMDVSGSVVFPTDNDDWFRHDAIARVMESKPSGLVRWNYKELMLGRVTTDLRVEDDWGPFYRYQCNNYAVVSPKPHEFLESHHPDMSGLVLDNEMLIGMSLSLHNKTPASISHPRTHPTTEELTGQVDEYIKNAESVDLPDFPGELEMLLNLMRRARRKRIHL